LDPKIAEALLPHTRGSVAGKFYEHVEWRDNSAVLRIQELPDTSRTPVRKLPTAAAMTEARSSSSPTRLARLARDGRVLVKRDVCDNPHIDAETHAYLLAWALKRDEYRSTCALLKHPEVELLLKADPELLARHSLPIQSWVGRIIGLPEERALPLLRGLLDGSLKVGNHSPEDFAWAVLRSYRDEDAKVPLGALLDELLAHSASSSYALWADAAWSVRTLDEPLVRRLLESNIPVSYGEPQRVTPAAAKLLVETRDPAMVRIAVRYGEGLDEQDYDTLLDVCFDQDDPSTSTRLLLWDPMHERFTDTQLARIVDWSATHWNSRVADSLLNSSSGRLTEDQIDRLLSVLDGHHTLLWLSGRGYRGIDHTPQRLRTAHENTASYAGCSWLPGLLEELRDDATTRRVALDLAGGAAVTQLSNSAVGHEVSAWFEEAFGSDTNRWNAAANLLSDWSGSFSELIDTVQTLHRL
jgi:hypothetical protein